MTPINLIHLDAWDSESGSLNVIIETPKGSQPTSVQDFAASVAASGGSHCRPPHPRLAFLCWRENHRRFKDLTRAFRSVRPGTPQLLARDWEVRAPATLRRLQQKERLLKFLGLLSPHDLHAVEMAIRIQLALAA
jgi:hypothetical protein